MERRQNDAWYVSVRRSTQQDGDAIAALSLQLGYPSTSGEVSERLNNIQVDPNHLVLIAETKGACIAWLHAIKEIHLESGEFVEIAGLIVDEASRGRGVGGLLVKEAEQWAALQGCEELRVRTNVLREQAPVFYERRGFLLKKQQNLVVKKVQLISAR